MNHQTIHFGTAGTGEDFAALGYKKTGEIPDYLAHHGLDAYELQCGRGVRCSAASAAALRTATQSRGMQLSIHAPYYISMSSMEEDKRHGSVRYLLESAELATRIGAGRVIFHSGSCGKQPRQQALAKALDTLAEALAALDSAGYGAITLCPETMGKVNQLGDLEEVLALCSLDSRLVPCIDFGHLNARTQGQIKTRADYARILDRMGEVLGAQRLGVFHIHFSKIEYTAGGEKRHLTFEDTDYGPEPAPLLEECFDRGLRPTIICESAGTQGADAAAMAHIWQRLSGAAGG